jgi:hypothetical protein
MAGMGWEVYPDGRFELLVQLAEEYTVVLKRPADGGDVALDVRRPLRIGHRAPSSGISCGRSSTTSSGRSGTRSASGSSNRGLIAEQRRPSAERMRKSRTRIR